MRSYPGNENSVVVSDFATTWASLESLDLPPVAAVLARSQVEALQAVRGHLGGGRETLIAAAGRLDHSLRADLLDAGFAIVDRGQSQNPVRVRPAEPNRVWLLTSGSTGRPKRVAHTVQSLTTVTTDQPERRWLLPYSPGTYAWWQLVTLSLFVRGQHLVPVEADELHRWAEVAARADVTAVSGTPTFWRQALWSSGNLLRGLPLEQVTLGGEPVDQAVLDALHDIFPAARVSWIYASSEAGASIAVHDGQAGFPVTWLDRDQEGRPRLGIHGDELVIESPHHGHGMAGPIHTGDRVQITNRRVHIVGRILSDEINVGGSKISAAAVRDVLLSHPKVAWASVRGRRAPIVGTVVSADVVVSKNMTEAELVAHCRRELPDYGVPRRFRFLNEIPLKETLKSDV